MVVAPARAFERIAARPEWVVAAILVVLLFVADALLEFPAISHILATIARGDTTAHRSSSEILGALLFNASIVPLVAIVLEAFAITIFATARDAKNVAAFQTFLSLVANVTVIAALGEFFGGLAIRLHDPTHFTTFASLSAAFPVTLAFLATAGNDHQADFLSHFGIFNTWWNIVLAFGLVRLGTVRLVPALVFVFTLDLVFALLDLAA